MTHVIWKMEDAHRSVNFKEKDFYANVKKDSSFWRTENVLTLMNVPYKTDYVHTTAPISKVVTYVSVH